MSLESTSKNGIGASDEVKAMEPVPVITTADRETPENILNLKERTSVSGLMRELAGSLVRLRQEAANLGAESASPIGIEIATGRELARRLKHEPSPLPLGRFAFLEEAARRDATPKRPLP